VIYTKTNDIIREPFCDLHTHKKTISLGTLSVIYTHIENDIIKDPVCDLHTHKKRYY
jgi:hypothetical protein